jgi:hypothetical protein
LGPRHAKGNYGRGINTVVDMVDRRECPTQSIQIVRLIEPFVLAPDSPVELDSEFYRRPNQ